MRTVERDGGGGGRGCRPGWGWVGVNSLQRVSPGKVLKKSVTGPTTTQNCSYLFCKDYPWVQNDEKRILV